MSTIRSMILCLVSLCILAGIGDARELTLATMEYPPYSGADLPNKGYLSEIAVTAFEKQGYTVKIAVVPWNRALERTKRGEYDGVFPPVYRKEREQWFIYTSPLPPIQLSFMKRTGFPNPSACTYEILKDYTIGVVRGYANPPEFDVIKDKLRIEEVTYERHNLQKLALKRIDLMMTDIAVAKYLIRVKFPEFAGKLEPINPLLFAPEDQYVCISKKIPDAEKLAADYSRSLQLMREDGTIDAISKKHGIK